MLAPGLPLPAPLIAALLMLGSSCAEEDLPPIVWEGEHVQVGTDLDLEEWCPGTLTRLDSYAGALKERFEVSDSHVVQYYLYPPPISNHDVCPSHGRACARENAVFTYELFDPHEVVHAVLAANGTGPHFFEEGAATYWGGHPLPVDFSALDIREVLDTYWSGGMKHRGYNLAAHFTSYLVRTHGMEPYLSLLRGASWKHSRAQFEPVFEGVFGLTLDAAIAGYEENWPYCRTADKEAPFYECSRPAMLLPPGGETDFDLDISCADPEVIGPSSLIDKSGPRIWRDFTVELASAENIVAFSVPEIGEPNTVAVQITRCDIDCRDKDLSTHALIPDGTGGAFPNYFSFNTPPGRYVVQVSRAADDPGPVRFRWR